jgi:hypothetical protein
VCRRLQKYCLLLCAPLIALAPSQQVFGQAVTATLVGGVSDSQGALISGAQITITEQHTGASASHLTNGSGNYEFTFLPPGVYTVQVRHEGFEQGIINQVNVPVNTTVRVDVKLKPGAISQSVMVTDEAPLLQTDRADVSGQIEAKQVSDLPLGNSRNFQALESLIPGVSPPIYDHSSFFDAQNSQSFQVNGQSETANNLQFEGIDDNERTGQLQVYIPPAAAIQTVDVETSNYAPEFGRSAGAVTNVTMKSGGTKLHGSAYEYNSVAATSARSYFNTGALPGFTNNYYGGTIGGPMLKGRTFFFGDFLRYSNHSSLFTLLTVPTAAFRTGNLAASPTTIYDPNTGNPDGTGRQQFVTGGVANVIPAARLNPIAQRLLDLVPEPNIPGAGLTNNYQENLGFRTDDDQFDIKLDRNLLASDHFSFRYSYQHITNVQDPAFGSAGGPGGTDAGFQGTGTNNVFNTAGEYTHVFSSNLIMEARLGVDHYDNVAVPTDYGSDAATQIGIPGANVNLFTSGLSSVSITGYSTPLLGYNASLPFQHDEANIDAVNNWTKVFGNHSVKFGGEVRRVRDDLTQGETFGPRGIFTYADGQTALNSSTSSPGFANAFASFLLDLPSQVGRDVNVGDQSFRQTLYFAFVQDTWQWRPNLTVTYGLRWEFYPPATPKDKGGFSQYDPATNQLQVTGYGGIADNLGLKVNSKDFEPRVGFAYRASSQLVVRGGFGISHTPMWGSYYADNYPVTQNIGFNPLTAYTPAINDSNVAATLEQGFPAAPQPVVPSGGVIEGPLSSLWYVVDQNYKDPYVMSYNLTVQQNLGHQWVATLAYVGNQGRQIPGRLDLNAGAVLGAGAEGQPEYLTFGRTNSTYLVFKGTTSNYNGLQAQLTRRFADGLAWTSSYAWQKAMGYIASSGSPGAFNVTIDFQRNYAPLTFNIAQAYAQSFVYELPFGGNKPLLNQGMASRIAGGWQLSTNLKVQTGTPLLLTADATQIDAPSNIQVPNEIKPFTRLHGIGVSKDWFDPTAFSQPVGPVFGNTGQDVYSGPGLFTLDSSLFRSFPIRESLALRLRMDAFNVLNHPNFANPTTSLTSSSFGQVTSTVGAARTLQFAGTLTF